MVRETIVWFQPGKTDFTTGRTEEMCGYKRQKVLYLMTFSFSENPIREQP